MQFHTKTLRIYPILFILSILNFVIASGNETYGSVIIKDVVSVYDGDTFKVNIDGYPAIVGENMSIRIAGIDTPEIRGTRGYTREVAEKARKFTQYRLKNAKVIKLKNMRRGKYFRIIADVYVDGENLAKEIIRVGLGKRYDGGPRPTW